MVEAGRLESKVPGPLQNITIRRTATEIKHTSNNPIRTARSSRSMFGVDSKNLLLRAGRASACVLPRRDPLPAQRPQRHKQPPPPAQNRWPVNKWLVLISLVIWSQEIRRLCRASLRQNQNTITTMAQKAALKY
jgi:hypothetical protein